MELLHTELEKRLQAGWASRNGPEHRRPRPTRSGPRGVRGTVSAWRIQAPLLLAVQRRSSGHCRKGFSTAKKLVIASWNTAGEKKTKTLPGHSSRNMTSPLLPSSKTLVTTFNWQMLTHIHQPSCKNVNARPC